MTTTLRATFTVQLTPADPIPGSAARLDLAKTWSGDLTGTSHGTMTTAGDPATGDAGYVATETFEGAIAGRAGTLTFLQLGTMVGGEPQLSYVIAPGSGTGQLVGKLGTLSIGDIDEDGNHEVTVQLA